MYLVEGVGRLIQSVLYEVIDVSAELAELSALFCVVDRRSDVASSCF